MPSSTPETGRTLHVVGVWVNRIGMVSFPDKRHTEDNQVVGRLKLYFCDSVALT
jgi:hypothetical protein